MSARDFPMRALDGALDRGDCLGAWSAAAEVRPPVNLDYALVPVVLAAGDPSMFPRAVSRWMARWEIERPGAARADDGQRISAALGALPDLAAITVLGESCSRLRFPCAERALRHLLPGGRLAR